MRFVTQHGKYAVSDTPFAVPSSLSRSGLGKVVNHLLEVDEDDGREIAFDFLVHGHLLRMPLERLILKLNLSTEDVITVEYFPAVVVSDDSSSCELPAWVSTLSNDLLEDEKGDVIIGSYDGIIRVLDSELLTTDDSSIGKNLLNKSNSISNGSQTHHNGPVKDISCFKFQDSFVVVSSGKDHKVNVYLKKKSSKKSKKTEYFSHVIQLTDHVNSVECVATWCTDSEAILVSADWSGNIFCYDIYDTLRKASNSAETLSSSATGSKSNKKMRINEASEAASLSVGLHTVKPSFHIHAHTNTISDIQLCNLNTSSSSASATHMITSSHDHSLKVWDLLKQDNVLTFNTGKVITSLHYSTINNKILTSHADGKIRVFDALENRNAQEEEVRSNTNGCLKTFGSNSSLKNNTPPVWISKVLWCYGDIAILFAELCWNAYILYLK